MRQVLCLDFGCALRLRDNLLAVDKHGGVIFRDDAGILSCVFGGGKHAARLGLQTGLWFGFLFMVCGLRFLKAHGLEFHSVLR